MWIDVEAARQSIDRAEAAFHADDLVSAWANGVVAATITRQPFLVGEELGWIRDQRAALGRGNRAEALRVFANCRKLFREELGAEPSEKTSAVFLEVLRG